MGKNSYKKFSLFHCILELDRIDFYFRAKLQIEILPMLYRPVDLVESSMFSS